MTPMTSTMSWTPQEMQDFFLSTGDDGFVTLTYYTSGARSFYTKDRAIRTPADLKGPEDPRAGYEEPDRHDELSGRHSRRHVLR